MLVTKEKVLVHFNTDEISAYRLNDDKLTLIDSAPASFNESPVIEMLLNTIDDYMDKLRGHVKMIDNEHTRLYATGMFQRLSPEAQTKIIIHVYVEYGLYFSIVPFELEQFYVENSMSVYGSQNMMKGLVYREFRNVVICGSFQQHLNEIGDVMTILQKRNIVVLSPWTTKVVPETLGTDFILLEGQAPLKNKRDAWSHKYEHMNKFRQSDAIVVCNPDGLIGKGTMFEFGFMVAHSKRIIFTERPQNLSIPFPYEVGLNFT